MNIAKGVGVLLVGLAVLAVVEGPVMRGVADVLVPVLDGHEKVQFFGGMLLPLTAFLIRPTLGSNNSTRWKDRAASERARVVASYLPFVLAYLTAPLSKYGNHGMANALVIALPPIFYGVLVGDGLAFVGASINAIRTSPRARPRTRSKAEQAALERKAEDGLTDSQRVLNQALAGEFGAQVKQAVEQARTERPGRRKVPSTPDARAWLQMAAWDLYDQGVEVPEKVRKHAGRKPLQRGSTR